MTFISAEASSAPCCCDGFIFEDWAQACQSSGTGDRLQPQQLLQQGGESLSLWGDVPDLDPVAAAPKLISTVTFIVCTKKNYWWALERVRQCRTAGTWKHTTEREWSLSYEIHSYIWYIHTFKKTHHSYILSPKMEKCGNPLLYISKVGDVLPGSWVKQLPDSQSSEKAKSKMLRRKEPKRTDHYHYFQSQKQQQGELILCTIKPMDKEQGLESSRAEQLKFEKNKQI